MMRPGHGKNQFQEKPASERAFPALAADSRFELRLRVRVDCRRCARGLRAANLASSQAGWRFLGPALAGMIAAGILKLI